MKKRKSRGFLALSLLMIILTGGTQGLALTTSGPDHFRTDFSGTQVSTNFCDGALMANAYHSNPAGSQYTSHATHSFSDGSLTLSARYANDAYLALIAGGSKSPTLVPIGQTNVFDLDFTDFRTPGRYYIAIKGVGRSFEFGIADDIYRSAFDIQAYGVFAQRCGQELAPPYSDWARIACHVGGIIPTTEKRYLCGEWGKFIENRIMQPSLQNASDALLAVRNAPSLIAYFPFDGDYENQVAGGMTLTPKGKVAYAVDGSVTGGKGDHVYASGETDNGFSGTLAFDATQGLTFSFWMRRDDSFAGNKYEGAILGLAPGSNGDERRARLGLTAGWGVIRLIGNVAIYGRVGDNVWRHYVVQVAPPDAQNDCHVSLIVDGKRAISTLIPFQNDHRFNFAHVFDDAAKGCFFDELRIYNDVLTDAAMEALGERVADKEPVVIQASGGHHDAGDYNPRCHIDVAQTLLSVYELFPRKFYDGQLNIPENANGVPDIVDEALWALRVWHGLYDPETGAVYNGTESQGDPNFIQTVELDDTGDYAWAPDSQGALTYAGTLAQAARILAVAGQAGSSKRFIERAEKAYAWGKGNKPDVTDIRVFGRFYVCPLAAAAAQLYHTTDQSGYHTDFLANVPWESDPNADILASDGAYDMSAAAYAYALIPDDKADPAIKKTIIAAIKRESDMYIAGSSHMAYKFVRHPYAPITWGTGAYPGFCMPVLHMYALADNPADRALYRDWLIRSCDNTLGSNPMNLSWVVGIGSQTIRAPLHNSRYSPFGMPVKGMQAQGPYQRGNAYHYSETAYPKHSDAFAVMHAFIDSAFAIPMDEGVVIMQAKTLAVFGSLLPDLPQQAVDFK